MSTNYEKAAKLALLAKQDANEIVYGHELLASQTALSQEQITDVVRTARSVMLPRYAQEAFQLKEEDLATLPSETLTVDVEGNPAEVQDAMQELNADFSNSNKEGTDSFNKGIDMSKSATAKTNTRTAQKEDFSFNKDAQPSIEYLANVVPFSDTELDEDIVHGNRLEVPTANANLYADNSNVKATSFDIFADPFEKEDFVFDASRILDVPSDGVEGTIGLAVPSSNADNRHRRRLAAAGDVDADLDELSTDGLDDVKTDESEDKVLDEPAVDEPVEDLGDELKGTGDAKDNVKYLLPDGSSVNEDEFFEHVADTLREADGLNDDQIADMNATDALKRYKEILSEKEKTDTGVKDAYDEVSRQREATDKLVGRLSRDDEFGDTDKSDDDALAEIQAQIESKYRKAYDISVRRMRTAYGAATRLALAGALKPDEVDAQVTNWMKNNMSSEAIVQSAQLVLRAASNRSSEERTASAKSEVSGFPGLPMNLEAEFGIKPHSTNDLEAKLQNKFTVGDTNFGEYERAMRRDKGF